MSRKTYSYIMMSFLVVIWGLDFVIAKEVLESFAPLTLLFIRYGIGLIALLLIKLFRDRQFRIRKKDIVIFALCSVFGEVIYFFFEYSALTQLPVSLVSIMLAFAPIVSVIIERIVFKLKATPGMIAGMLISILGVALVLGADLGILSGGAAIGYLLVFGAIISLNIYNFLTERLTGEYDSVTLLIYQMICTVLICAPMALGNLPAVDIFTPVIIGQITYLGLISGALGFLIYVKSLEIIGSTPCMLFQNFIPVTTTFLGWIILGESITLMQLLGGAVVVGAGFMVIRFKDKRDRLESR